MFRKSCCRVRRNTRVRLLLCRLGVHAGGCVPGNFVDQQIDDFEHSMRLNYMSALFTAKVATDAMIRNKVHGKIVFVASTLALTDIAGYSTYSPTKHALRSKVFTHV